ncbi:MAG TPA: hypothetical protein GXZ95_05150 [Mollicutes bacterium]|nr:hypothetical protein [Mollicutes bacterium]
MKKQNNVITLIIFCAITIVCCVYALKWHAVYKEDVMNRAIITSHIQEIKESELENYTTDNPYAVIYFGVPSDENCRAFEKKLQRFLDKKDLRELFVYLNVSDIADGNFKETFDNTYNTKDLREKNKFLYEVPAVAIYDHTTMVDFVSGKNLTIEKVEKLLNKHKLGEK